MAAVTILDGFNMIALAYREKPDNGMKAKAKKAKFLGYFLATGCVTILPGIQLYKEENYTDGTRSP